MKDKEIEKERYNKVADKLLKQVMKDKLPRDYLFFLPLYLHTPYVHFKSILRDNLSENMTALEIGSGTSGITIWAVESGAKIISTDISETSVLYLNQAYAKYPNFVAIKADMEKLPFCNGQFDLVFCAGALSYGDNQITRNEISRVLKSGGKFLCVDSLNNNWLYKFNRYIRYYRGSRTKYTLRQMPDLLLLKNYTHSFTHVKITYHGSISWLCPILCLFVGLKNTAKFSDWFDKLIKVKGSGFKFTMVATKK